MAVWEVGGVPEIVVIRASTSPDLLATKPWPIVELIVEMMVPGDSPMS